MNKNTKLYYVHDPMCSWCWGFEVIRQQLFAKLKVPIDYLVGGLAPDTTEPMPVSLQQKLQLTWQRVNQVTGARFNFDFWHQNTPIRSTYPACRAILAAKQQQAERKMVATIQQAYYTKAQNPSLSDTLINCATEIQLDVKQFQQDFTSTTIDELLHHQINSARRMSGNSFPSLILESQQRYTNIAINYTDVKPMYQQISQQLI